MKKWITLLIFILCINIVNAQSKFNDILVRGEVHLKNQSIYFNHSDFANCNLDTVGGKLTCGTDSGGSGTTFNYGNITEFFGDLQINSSILRIGNLSNLNVSNATTASKMNCAGTYGGPDTDFCTDATGGSVITNKSNVNFTNIIALGWINVTGDINTTKTVYDNGTINKSVSLNLYNKSISLNLYNQSISLVNYNQSISLDLYNSSISLNLYNQSISLTRYLTTVNFTDLNISSFYVRFNITSNSSLIISLGTVFDNGTLNKSINLNLYNKSVSLDLYNQSISLVNYNQSISLNLYNQSISLTSYFINLTTRIFDILYVKDFANFSTANFTNLTAKNITTIDIFTGSINGTPLNLFNRSISLNLYNQSVSLVNYNSSVSLNNYLINGTDRRINQLNISSNTSMTINNSFYFNTSRASGEMKRFYTNETCFIIEVGANKFSIC